MLVIELLVFKFLPSTLVASHLCADHEDLFS